MNVENLEAFLKTKKEAAQIEINNLRAKKYLANLLEKGGSISGAKYYRPGENIFLGKDLGLRGYHPEDMLIDNIKKVEGPAEIRVSVMGPGIFERILITKRK